MSRKQSERIGRIMESVREADARRQKARRDWQNQSRGDVLVTLRHRQTDELRTVRGTADSGRNEAVVNALAAFTPDAWQVRAISSVGSILTDLQRPQGGARRAQLPELMILGQIRKRAFL